VLCEVGISHRGAESSKFWGDDAQVGVSSAKVGRGCCLPLQSSPAIGTGTCIPVYKASHPRTTRYFNMLSRFMGGRWRSINPRGECWYSSEDTVVLYLCSMYKHRIKYHFYFYFYRDLCYDWTTWTTGRSSSLSWHSSEKYLSLPPSSLLTPICYYVFQLLGF
jgi:hypothetical protein